VDGREAAFRNTTSQCVEMIASCFRRMESGGDSTGPALQTYLRGLKTLSAAVQYRNCPELEEPLAQQLRILDAAVRTGAALGSEDRSFLGSAFQTTRSVLDRISSGGDVQPAAEPAVAPQSANAGRGRSGILASTIRSNRTSCIIEWGGGRTTGARGATAARQN
jgi:hypothetical protein